MKAYIAKHTKDNIRLKSRSGGAFFALAQRFMDENDGVVYGVVFDIEEKIAKHTRIDNKDNLSELQGSKYVQSDSSIAMKQALLDINKGKKVLFSGTSCQVAGMISVCPENKRNNLYTIDIICHGVPSPGVCASWLDEKEKKLDEKLIRVDFRNKFKFGWMSHKETIYTKSKQFDNDEYAKLFYGHNVMRPSCYKCLYRSLNGVSDISLGDAWTAKQSDFFDEKGVSLVLVNSNRGEKMMHGADLYKKRVNIQDYMQSPLKETLKKPVDRNAFWKKYHSADVTALLMFENGAGVFRIKRYIRKAIYKLFERLEKDNEDLSK